MPIIGSVLIQVGDDAFPVLAGDQDKKAHVKPSFVLIGLASAHSNTRLTRLSHNQHRAPGVVYEFARDAAQPPTFHGAEAA